MPKLTDAKRPLAVRAVAAQEGPEMNAMLAQLAGSATQQVIGNWDERVASLPAAKQAKRYHGHGCRAEKIQRRNTQAHHRASPQGAQRGYWSAPIPSVFRRRAQAVGRFDGGARFSKNTKLLLPSWAMCLSRLLWMARATSVDRAQQSSLMQQPAKIVGVPPAPLACRQQRKSPNAQARPAYPARAACRY